MQGNLPFGITTATRAAYLAGDEVHHLTRHNLKQSVAVSFYSGHDRAATLHDLEIAAGCVVTPMVCGLRQVERNSTSQSPNVVFTLRLCGSSAIHKL
jgi:hypothetical protein